MMHRKKTRKQDRSKRMKEQYKIERPRMTLYNPLSSIPDTFDMKVKTFQNILPTGATVAVLTTIYTNTLLHSSDDMGAAAGQNSSLTNIGRNYSKYRVVSYRLDYTLLPRSTTIDSAVAVVNTPVDQSGQFVTSAWVAESVTRDKSKVHIVPRGTSSPSVCSSSLGHSIAAILGNSEYEQDDKYYGTITSAGVFASPTDLTYAYFYAGSQSGAAYTASTSPSVHVMLTQYVTFYDKRY